MTKFVVKTGDCIELLSDMDEQSIDLVFGSPPYEDARTYGIGFCLSGQAWVEWMADVVQESLRICTGLVAFVVEGRTSKFRWTATPALLMAELHHRGVCLRKPPAFHRIGIPGSGGPDWLRNDYEFIVCATNGGKLRWSDNTAMGHPPKFPPGGAPSHQSKDGRVNKPRPQREGNMRRVREYKPPTKANPGNVIHAHGGGHLGSKLAHENEAPFPESLAEFFVRSFCPPGGIVLDPFCGSGTTIAVALKHGRNAIGFDVRQSQVELTQRRLDEVRESLAKESVK
jgi:site-specific DNA-methyltransferase (adenine-specific)